MALLALLALALAQPLIRTSPLATLLGMRSAPRTVAIVLDDSASMAAASERGVLLDRAKTGALHVLDSLSSSRGDRATLILGGQREAGPVALFDQPTPDLNQVRHAIEQIKLTDLATDLDSAVARARAAIGDAQAASTSERREIYVISDLQQAALQQRDTFDLGPTTGLLLVSTRPQANGAAANLSVDAVQYGAARPMVGVPFTFRALVTNHGDAPRTSNVELVIGKDVVRQKEIHIPAGRSIIVRFNYRFTKGGWHGGHVRLAATTDSMPDAMTSDDARHFALRVADEVHVLAVNGAASAVESRDELLFFHLALTVAPHAQDADGMRPPIELTTITPEQLDASYLTDPQRVVVLANVAALPEDTLEALERFVDGGGNVLITLGDRVRPAQYNQWLGDNRLHGGLLPGRLLQLANQRTQTETPATSSDDAAHPIAPDPEMPTSGIDSIDTHHPILAGFETGELGRFSEVRFQQYYHIKPVESEVLMEGDHGSPLLLEKRFGKGRVMLFASSIDRDWTNFPLQPTYVPWLYRTVSYLAQPMVGEANFIRTGQIVALPSATTSVEPMQIERPDGTIGYPEPDPRQPGSAQQALTDTTQAGVYTVRTTGQSDTDQPSMMFAANIAPEESQTDYWNESAITKTAGDDAAVAFVNEPESIDTTGEVARQGYGLWNVLLWIALAVALIEPWLANQLSKRRGGRVRDALGQRDAMPADALSGAPRQQNLKRETAAV